MKRFGTMWLGGAAVLVMAAGACGSVASTPLGATGVPAADEMAGSATSATTRPAPAAPLPGTLVPVPEPEDLVKIRGTVQSVRVPDLEVDGQMLHTGERTVIVDRDGRPIGFDSIRVGQMVEAEALTQPDRSLFALTIKILDDNRPTTGPPTNTWPRR
jgi:hypothetical protein